MIVAGIDPSLTNTGLAVLNAGTPVALHSTGWGTGDGKSTLDRNRRIRALNNDVCQWIRRHKPDLVAVESPLLHPANGYAFDRFTLFQFIIGQFDIWGIPTVEIHNRKRPVWATGIAGASKTQVLEAVRSFWPTIKILNDDIADAAALSLMAGFHYGEPMPFEVKARHTNGLQGVAWPGTTRGNS